MRIIAGQARRKRLIVPDLPGVRPTSDRARETLFNVLQPQLHDARVLDLFAGSGALGLEAVSRGARCATFVDRQRKVTETLRANITNCDFEAACDVIVADYRAALRRLGAAERAPFDLVFADPPYGSGHGVECLALLQAHGLCARDGRVILEQRHDETVKLPAQWASERHLRVGDTAFLLCSRVEPDGASC